MALVDIDIEDHLHQVGPEFLIGALAEQYVRANSKRQVEIIDLLRKQLKFDATRTQINSDNIEEQSKRELIEQFIGQISYDDLSRILSSIQKLKA